MYHLFNSVVKTRRLVSSQVDGLVTTSWTDISTDGLDFIPCRVDLNFIRPGKDDPAPINAGGAQDRYGILFCPPYFPLKAGDRVECIANAYGQLPVEGTFEIRSIPDKAIDFSRAHHIEVLVFEIPQDLDDSEWPVE
jgi:hypothetical protein